MRLDLARTVSAAPPRRFALGLSGRLLLLTVFFVMLAQVLIFAPGASSFRSAWLGERLEAARLASLAVEAAPDRMVNNRLAGELLASAGVSAVAIRRDGVRELVLNAASPGAMAEFTVDLRTLSRWDAMVQTARAFFPQEGAYLRIVGDARMERVEFVEALVPQAPLGRELRAWSARFFVSSLVISLITASLIYVTLTLVLVRPIRRLTAAMTEFGAAPERAPPPAARHARGDELGQAESALADMQRGLSQTLRQKQRLAALGEAVSRISHDLRHVLSSASLISDRLAGDKDARVREMGARVLRSIDRAAGLCEATLRFGAAGEADSPRPQTLKLRAALDDAALEALPDGAQESASGSVPVWDNRVADGAAVRCDPEHLHRIALNLFRNAAAAMEMQPGAARLTVTAAHRDGGIHIVIADTGPGLPPRAQDNLFRPFSASGFGASGGNGETGGAGLGLAIARDLARANGGELRLIRTGPDGAAFELVLKPA